MRTVFLLDRREDKSEHILQNLKIFLQFSGTGMQLKTSFEKVEWEIARLSSSTHCALDAAENLDLEFFSKHKTLFL